jgi:hypothetical protein
MCGILHSHSNIRLSNNVVAELQKIACREMRNAYSCTGILLPQALKSLIDLSQHLSALTRSLLCAHCLLYAALTPLRSAASRLAGAEASAFT